MSDNNFNGAMDALLKGMDTVLSAKTVVGEAVKMGDTTIIPLVDIAFGVGVGSGTKAASGGMGGRVTPAAILVINEGHVKLINIKNHDAVTRIFDIVPELIDRIIPQKDSNPSDDEVIEVAFPKKQD